MYYIIKTKKNFLYDLANFDLAPVLLKRSRECDYVLILVENYLHLKEEVFNEVWVLNCWPVYHLECINEEGLVDDKEILKSTKINKNIKKETEKFRWDNPENTLYTYLFKVKNIYFKEIYTRGDR